MAETTEKTEDQDLQDQLSQQTEKKSPGASAPKPATNFWAQQDDDFESGPSKKEEPEVKEKPADQKVGDPVNPEAPKKVITEKILNGSANTAVGMVDLTTKAMLTPILGFRVKKKLEKVFTDADLEKIENKLIDAELEGLDKEDKRIKKRFDSIMAKYNKKVDQVPMTDPQKANLHDCFYNYFDYTQTTLSPGIYLAMGLLDHFGGKCIDAFTGDF